MFKKFLTASLLILGLVAATAAETNKPAAGKRSAAKRPNEMILLSINLAGDNEATFEVLEKSKNVRPRPKATGFINKKPGRALSFVIVPAAKGKTVATLKLKVNGKGAYNFSGVGFDAKKQNVWFYCSSFEIGETAYIPQGKVKKLPFAKWKKLTGAKDIAIDGEQELEVKMAFEKVPAKIAAKFAAGARKSAKPKAK